MYKPTFKTLKLDTLRMDGGTQPRAGTSKSLIEEYIACYQDGAEFPPLTVFYDGTDYWLADGFHRAIAADAAGQDKHTCEIHKGDLRAAILHSVGANALHGARRTNADKRHAVETLLADKEWAGWSNRQIARCAQVSEAFVRIVREELSAHGAQMDNVTRTVERNGVSYPQNTTKIGTATPTAKRIITQAEYEKEVAAEATAKDQVGNALPEKLKATFARRGELGELMQALSNVKAAVAKKVSELDPIVATLNATEFSACLTNARRALHAQQPYAVCPSCGGDGCRLCQDRGWLGQLAYDHFASDDIKKAQKAGATKL